MYRTFQLMLFKICSLLLKYWQLKIGLTDAYQYSLGYGVQMFKLLYNLSTDYVAIQLSEFDSMQTVEGYIDMWDKHMDFV